MSRHGRERERKKTFIQNIGCPEQFVITLKAIITSTSISMKLIVCCITTRWLCASPRHHMTSLWVWAARLNPDTEHKWFDLILNIVWKIWVDVNENCQNNWSAKWCKKLWDTPSAHRGGTSVFLLHCISAEELNKVKKKSASNQSAESRLRGFTKAAQISLMFSCGPPCSEG